MKNSTYLLRKFLFLTVVFFFSFIQFGSTQQVAKSLIASNGTFIGFWEYKPVDYSANPTTKYPLIIFLHGIGERGNGTTQLASVLGAGPPKHANASTGVPMRFFWNGKWETFLVLSPQLSTGYSNWQNFYVDEMLNHAKNNLRVDTNRIFLTGLSLGGGGTWWYASSSLANAKKFAAIAPICGTCSINNAANLANANLPVWAFHAVDDGVVGVSCTVSAINAINSFNPAVKPIQYLYPNGNHYIWDRSYDTVYDWHNPHLYEWFLGQDKSLAPNVMPNANAGTDITIQHTVGTVTLNGSASSDPDGNIAKFVWKRITGPNAGTITSPNSAVTSVTGLTTVGTYQYELTVADNRSGWKRDTVRVNVIMPVGSPTARAGGFAMINLPTNNFNLDGTGSTDPDGTIVSYSWSKVSGPSATFANPNTAVANVSGLSAGQYYFRLLVTDNNGYSDDDTMRLFVNSMGVANAGPDININFPVAIATLNGTASYDPDGPLSAYQWTQVAGPAPAIIVTPAGSSTLATTLLPGNYRFQLVVWDNMWIPTMDTVQVNVLTGAPPPPNQAPTSNAGTDITITLPTSNTTLNGSGSGDPDGTISSYSWSKISGPASFTIANGAAASTALSNLVQGTYAFRLLITDNGGLTDDDTVVVTVNAGAPPPNQAPNAYAGADISLTLPTNNTTLNGSGSSDPDGTISTYTWTWLSGPATYTIANPNTASTALTNLVQGTYSFRLAVTDNGGLTDADTVIVTVNNGAPPPNQAPNAYAGADILFTLPLSNTTLNGTGSSDPDGTISSYSWTWVSGPATYTIANPAAASTALSNLIGGTYTFRLVVTDNTGATDDDTVLVVANNPAVANAGADITITLPTNSTILNGSASADPDGSLKDYLWTKISGPASFNILNPNTATTNLSNLTQGTYRFRLTVWDNLWVPAADTVVVVVNAAPPPPNQAPTANAGSDISITLPVSNTTLNGTGSNDVDGSITAYSWTKISGPASFTIANGAIASTALTNLVQGTYSFRLQVTDNGGLTDDDTVVVTVNAAPPPPGIAPVANAGTDISITLPIDFTTLDGSGSNDPDGSISVYSWTKISGPSQFTIVNPAVASTNLTNLAQGTYSFRLLVTDNSGTTDDDTVVVTVTGAAPPPNQAPVAYAGADINLTLPANSSTLNGSGSGDPDGTISTYSWTKIGGPASYTISNPNSASTSVTGLGQGVYSFRLVVTDNLGASDDDTVVVTVNAAPPPPNQAPNAYAGADVTLTLPTSSTTLNGSGSNDPDGTISSYSWTKIGGPAGYALADAAASQTLVSNLTQGTYTFRLVVTDNNGLSDDDTVVITVNIGAPPPNQPPVAYAGSDISVTLPTNSTTLNGSGSNDQDGTITNYAWTWLSGPAQYSITNAAAATTGLDNLVQGTYSFRLVVTDNSGATDSDTVTVTVNAAPPPPNQAPVAYAGSDISMTMPANSTMLNGNGSSDPDGTITTYSWTKIGGPALYTIADPAAASTNLVGLSVGTYSFRLVVTDNSGATDSDTVMVTVNPAPPPPNALPIANAGADFVASISTPVVPLNGSASYDPDGTIVAYNWVKISGAGAITVINSTTPTPNVLGMQVGEYIFQLTVTDDEGASSSDQVTVTVGSGGNRPPVANAGRDTIISVPANKAVLTGIRSGDTDGFIYSYYWRQIDGPSSSTIEYRFNPVTLVGNLMPGDYLFELEITDNNGAKDTDTVMISVVNNFRTEDKMIVYPNPASGILNIRCITDTLGVATANVYDMNGRFVKSMSFTKSQAFADIPLNVVGLKSGVYVLEVVIDNKKKMMTKFIKR